MHEIRLPQLKEKNIKKRKKFEITRVSHVVVICSNIPVNMTVKQVI